MSGEIAAVDAGHIVGQERRQRLRVVPVVEVAAMALQGLHRVHGIGRAFEQVVRSRRIRSRGRPG